MADFEGNRLPKQARTYFRVRALTRLLLIVGYPTALLLPFSLISSTSGAESIDPVLVRNTALAMAALLVPYGILSVAVLPTIRWRNWAYAIGDHDVRLRDGGWWVTDTLVPLVRVQHVTMEQGPLQRRLGVARVTVKTAGSQHVLDGLDPGAAELLRDQIAELARTARESV